MAGKKRVRKSPASARPEEPAPPGSAETEAMPPLSPVAGFGASAGGLEAFTELLQHLPDNTGMSIVLIQHLDPKHSSVLTELLARSTKMPVTQVTAGMAVEPNRIYVIPPNSNITISKGVLDVQPRPLGIPHMPIDHFFRSLAVDQGSKAIGVVLSGTATDGTLGLKAIKAEGGITFAQSPESARFDGMPRSAIASGFADLVMTPAAISSELVSLSRHPYLSKPRPPETPSENDRDFAEILAMLRNATGVDFSHYKPGTIRRRTQRRMALHNLQAPGQYVRRLRERPEELDLLFQDILINVTGFFREPATFAALRSSVYPAIFKDRKSAEALRVWVPGCATGEEAYSVAISLLEYIEETRSEVSIQVFGTDLSEAALTKARAGVYPENIAADVSADRLRRFFVRVNGSYQIARFVRDLCVFARQNVTKDPPFSRLDLITCCNVMIYLGPLLQGKVLRLFHYALKPSGYLVLGASESIGNGGDLFAQIDKQHRIYSRKPAQVRVYGDGGSIEEREALGQARKSPAGEPDDGQKKVDQLILSQYSPPAVVVDGQLRILMFRGDTAPFLGHPSGEASLELMKLTRGGLGLEIRKVVRQAAMKAGHVAGDPVTVSFDGKPRAVRISATPLSGLPDPRFLVVFENVPQAPARPVPKRGAGKRPAPVNRTEELEQEFASTRQYLHAVIQDQETSTEEIKSAHEEVQSSNEEMQSTNEELLTAKEELQSANEELTTVNDEMQTRNAELQQANNDLLNLLSIPIVMLGNDLKIRRFTPQAERILNLLPADVGRPVSDFRLKIKVPDLVSLCQEVADTLVVREREVQDAEGRMYSMWIRPYRTTDNRIDGVVLALFDMTERKQAADARYRRLFEAAKDGIVMADLDTGEIGDSNPSVADLFGYQRARLVGVKFWESALFSGSAIDASVRTELQSRESVQKTLLLRTESGERVETDVVASLYAEGERKVIQFNLRDISARRLVEERIRQNEEELYQLQKMEAVGRLAGGVAHDFNNLLTAVLGYAELLGQELDDDHPGYAMLAPIREGAERAITLTRQLLAFGHKQIVSPTLLDVNVAIAEFQQVAAVVLSSNVRLATRLDADGGWVRMDRAQLEQLVLNLVQNARDAMPAGGTVTLETGVADVDQKLPERLSAIPVGRYVTITVKDTGTGMDDATKSHLFEPFYTTKPKGVGVGLGLSTVYGIVRQNDGHIRAFSELGVGSAFTVYLPRVEPERGSSEAVPGEGARGTETVLVVEDERAVRMLVRRFLEMEGYTVLEAASGPDALKIARSHDGPIHLMVTDVVMPLMSGREVAFQLVLEHPAMKVLYMSGHTEDAIVHHGVLDQGLAFLQKPFTQQALLTRIRRILDDPALLG